MVCAGGAEGPKSKNARAVKHGHLLADSKRLFAVWVHGVAATTFEIAARCIWVGRFASFRRWHNTAFRNHDVIFADAEFLAAERAYRDGDAAGKAGFARRFWHAVTVVVASALVGAQPLS